jgi:hypothetical protein
MIRERLSHRKEKDCLLRLPALILFFIVLSAGISFGGDDGVRPGSSDVKDVPIVAPQAEETLKPVDGWISLWGVPSRDALLLGMWSLHTSPKRHNSTQNLVGLQYHGYFAVTFKNSYYKQSYFGGVTRTIYIKRIAQDLDFDITYKAGLIWGYQDRYPNLGGISPVIFPTFGLSYKMFGTDFVIFPARYPAFAVSFRVNIERLIDRRFKTPYNN